MNTLTQQNNLYSFQFQTLSDHLHRRISPRDEKFENVWERSYDLSHEEMVSMSLLEVLADKYDELDNETRECLILMYIENQVSIE